MRAVVFGLLLASAVAFDERIAHKIAKTIAKPKLRIVVLAPSEYCQLWKTLELALVCYREDEPGVLYNWAVLPLYSSRSTGLIIPEAEPTYYDMKWKSSSVLAASKNFTNYV